MKYIMPLESVDQTKEFSQLDSFTQGFVEALFFAEVQSIEEQEFLETEEQLELNFGDLSPELLQRIIDDCADFQARHADELQRAYDLDYSPDQAGIDFLFSRNGHGAGFFDRGKESVWEELQEAARVYGSIDVYIGNDGKIYA